MSSLALAPVLLLCGDFLRHVLLRHAMNRRSLIAKDQDYVSPAYLVLHSRTFRALCAPSRRSSQPLVRWHTRRWAEAEALTPDG